MRTVIDLQEKGKRDEPKWVENAGMKFFKIRLSTTRRPTAEETEYFLKLVNDPENQPVLFIVPEETPYRFNDGDLSHHT